MWWQQGGTASESFIPAFDATGCGVPSWKHHDQHIRARRRTGQAWPYADAPHAPERFAWAQAPRTLARREVYAEASHSLRLLVHLRYAHAMNISTLTSYPLLDAHVHLEFMSNAREVACEAEAKGLALFANTVTPTNYQRCKDLLGDLSHVRVGLGLHPWWISDSRCDDADLMRLLDLVPTTAWIGEVGLDFSPTRTRHHLQLHAFERIAQSCAQQGGKVLSIHAVRSASTVLDVLEKTGCLKSCTCVFHWFSGSTDDLWRAIHAGCWFSVNEMQARTRRAKEQLRLIPSKRLLFETDLPPNEDVTFSAEQLIASLVRAQELTQAIRAD